MIGPIEKGANDGQAKHGKDLIAAIKAGLPSRPRAATGASKGKRKGRKSGASKIVNSTAGPTSSAAPAPSDWGLLEPVHGLLGPVVDIAKPILTGNVLYGLLVGLLVASWFRVGSNPKAREVGMFTSPERLAAYEEIWRREENELWDWLEDRVGMDRLRDTGSLRSERLHVEGGLRHEKMETRAIDNAVRVTEEKLAVLKKAIEDRKRKME